MDTNGIWVTDTNLTPKNQEFRHQVLASGRSSSDVSKDSNTLATVMANEDVIQPKRRKAVKQIEEDKFRKRNRQVVDSKNTKVSSHSKQDQGRVLPEERIPPLHFPSQNLGNGLLVSVLKTDLGEILRRSYRERTNNSRFNDGALANDKECHTSLNRVKANSTEHNISLVSAARRLHLKKKNGMLAGRSITTVKERDIFGALKFNNVEENDKKLTVCRSDKARKSFPLRTSPNGTFDDETAKKPKSPKALIFNRSCGIVSPESSGFSSNDAEVALAPAADGSYLQVRSCMLKRSRRKGRHFKGSTYYLSIHPNRRKRRVHSVGNLASFTKAKLNHVLKKTSESMDAVPGIDTDRVDEADAVVNSNPVSIGEHFLTKCINKFNAKSRNGLLSETQQPSMKEGLQNTDDKSREERLETLSYNHAPSENYTKHFQTINMGSMDSKEMFCSQQLGLNTKGKLVNTSTCDDFSSCAQEVTGICHYPTSDNRISEMTVENILMMRGPLTNLHNAENSLTESVTTRSKVKSRDREEKDVVALPTSVVANGERTYKASNDKCGPWSSPLIIPFAWNEDKKRVTSVTVQQVEFVVQGHLLCTCSTQDGSFVSKDVIKSYCQGIDYIDCRLIGCVNAVATNELLRPSARVPFQALCEIHRRRLKMHQCCPCCGLFCTQGSFIQCYADPQKPVHHSHKECILFKDNKPLCPHCGKECQLVETDVELNAPQDITFFLKQHQQMRKEPGARMAFTRGNENVLNVDLSDSLPVKSFKLPESAGLPIGSYREQLETLFENLTNEQPVNQRYSLKNIHAAVKNGDVEKLIQVLMIGFDPNTRFDDFGRATVLHIAAYHGHLCLVHILTQGGASLDALDSMLQTPIMLSIENGHNLVSQYLIKAGAQLDARGEDGMTALHLAAKAGQLDICRIILDTGKVNVNILDDGGWTPLVWAAEHQHLSVVKFLLERGSNPNLRDNEHNIALHWSAYSGSLDICEIFLNHGCDINSVNDNGDTPLHIAARQDKYEVVMLLLARNADVDACNKENETPIMCCQDQTAQTWLALSMTKHLKKMSGNRTNRTEVIVHKDISRGKELNPIQCVNSVDDEGAPSDFIYVNENCETLPINMDRSISSLQSCYCEDDCSSPNCTCGAMSLKCWYTKEGRLIDGFNLLDPPMIFECNRACRCWTSCNNRVVQHGITCRLQLFRTKLKGWGVRALQEIPRGTFICEYIGELISDLEADQREDDSYLFDLDNRDGETFCIDARRYGNISRFINHLCEPNLVPVKIFVDYQDFRFPRIAFFSSRIITANEELGFDYGDKFWIIKSKTFTCSCGAEKCKYSETTIQETLDSYHRRLQEQE